MVPPFVAALLLSAGGLACAAPAPTSHTVARLQYRAADCTFTDVAAAIKSKSTCSTIVLSNIAVPAGTTLDMTKLNSGTTVSQLFLLTGTLSNSLQVIFDGTTSFGYTEWKGPLISISGTNITVKGSEGHIIDGNGPKWWDGKGSNGGKTKPKVQSYLLAVAVVLV